MAGRNKLIIKGRTTAAIGFKAGIVANGGSISNGRLFFMNRAIVKLQNAGLYNDIDDIWMLATESSSVQALMSWKRNVLAVAATPPTFGATCAVFNGTTQFIDTLYNPSLHAKAMTGIDMMLGVYEVTNLSASTYAAGFSADAARGLRVQPRSGTVMRASANFTANTFTISPSDSRALMSAYRTPTDFGGSRNGVSLGTVTPATVDTVFQNLTLYIGGVNTLGALATPRASNCGYVVAGKSTIALSVPFYTIMQEYMTSINAAV